jgi:hypothetical protein
MMDQQRVDMVIEVWRAIHDNWAKKNRLEYVVIPSEDIRGKSMEDVKQLSFKVGVTEADTVTMTVQELTAFFLLVKDQHDQLHKMALARQEGRPQAATTSLSTVMNFAPTDDEIKSVLSGIQFTIRVAEGESPPLNTSRDGNDHAAGNYGVTDDRINYIFSLVKKKTDAGFSGKIGNHFRVYPPAEFLQDTTVLGETNIYEKLKDSVWWLRWYDDRYDQLRFMEFLIFVHQIIATQMAFEKAQAVVKNPNAHRASKHSGGWHPKKDRGRKPQKRDAGLTIRIQGHLDPRELANDVMIRALISKTELESTPRPSDAMN